MAKRSNENARRAPPGVPRGLMPADEADAQSNGYGEFEIDIEKVMRADLPPAFATIPPAPLSPSAIPAIPEGAKGAYMLFPDDYPVYAGKTDTRDGFRNRLSRHHYTLQHRHGVDLARMYFKAVRVLVFSNFDVEAILIQEMRRSDRLALPWNNTGFGSNDPGHNREEEEPGEFDRTNPINIDVPLEPPILTPGPVNLSQALIQMKDGLPYTFRYETDATRSGRPAHYRSEHRDHAVLVTIPGTPLTPRGVLSLALSVLPDGWRVTVFPGRVIFYKDSRNYRYAIESFAKP